MQDSRTNFEFLKSDWPQIYESAFEAERNIDKNPRTAAFYCRLSLERAVDWLYRNDEDLTDPAIRSLGNRLMQEGFGKLVPPELYRDLQMVRREGNNAVHGKRVSRRSALLVLRQLFRFLSWLANLYGTIPPAKREFNELIPVPSKPKAEYSPLQMLELQKAFDRQQAEVNLLKADQEELKAQIKAISERKKQKEDKQPPLPSTGLTEQETRERFVDLLLRESGWDPQAPNVAEYEVSGMPLSSNKSGLGYVDYVLWGADGKPLALVEAKKTTRHAEEGRKQAKLYADCLEQQFGQRPLIYYTNGFETFFWDDLFYPPRQVQGMHSASELALLIERRSSRKDIRNSDLLNPNIAGRPYQMRAINAIANEFTATDEGKLVGRHRKALIVMATGTGKTRTSISLVDLMMRQNWCKRVLFLADRRSLVKQAKDAFADLLPDFSAVNLSEMSEEDSHRLVFSTYPTMMNRIDNAKSDDLRFYGIGHFDLIIVDEAHRSVYKKYRAIFEYFDSLLVGLTATPRDEADKDTYGLFECDLGNPTYAYELNEAIEEEYLVPMRVRQIDLGFLKSGIVYADLPDHEKLEYEEKFRDDEGQVPDLIDSNALNRWLFNANTIDQVIHYLMNQGLRVEGGEVIGKTIIFARNHKHALKIIERFEAEFPEHRGKYAQLIDSHDPYAQDSIENFKHKRMPRIAVSVDMLDTGIDVPELVNLVFFKPVFSRTKFWQMIGRGTRLCPDLFAPGQDKEHFCIFDFCSNFDFFEENAEGLPENQTESLSTRTFKTIIQSSEALRSAPYNTDEVYIDLRNALLDRAHEMVRTLWKQRSAFRLKKVIRYLDYYNDRDNWNNLNTHQIAELFNHLAVHVQLSEQDEKVKRFDLMCFELQLAKLTEDFELAGKNEKRLQSMAEFWLTVSNIPLVKEELPLIQEVANAELLSKKPPSALEDIRGRLRVLAHIIKVQDSSIYDTNFKDTLTERGGFSGNLDYSNTGESYRMKVRKFVEGHKEHMIVQKIHRNIPITTAELTQLEELIGLQESESMEEVSLGALVRSLTGLDTKAADEAFADFIRRVNPTTEQLDFLAELKRGLIKKGVMNKEALFQEPFVSIYDGGALALFSDQEVGQIISILDRVTENTRAKLNQSG